jgi:excinuclease ABC subunit C
VDHILHFSPEHDRELFAEVPAAAAVFALYGRSGAEPYVSRTTNLRRRLIRLLGSAETTLASSPAPATTVAVPAPSLPQRRLNLRDRVARIEYWPVGSDFEAQLVLYRVLRQHFPDRYRDRLRLRPAPLVKFDLANQFPRAYVTTKIGRLNGPSVYYGPFPSRTAAEKFLNDSLDLFLIRRCPDDLNPDPAFPGCIYSEMKMCLAPCFGGCTNEQYSTEVRRVQRYLDTGGESLHREIEAERDRASASLEFESAAALHGRLAKAHEAAGQRPEQARRIDDLNGLMVQPSTTTGAVKFFRVEHGTIGEPFDFAVATDSAELLSGNPHRQHMSMESRIADALEHAPASAKLSAGEVSDHVAILRRWIFRSNKTGELFLTDRRGEAEPELPIRRVVRGVSRVYAGQTAGAPTLNPK